MVKAWREADRSLADYGCDLSAFVKAPTCSVCGALGTHAIVTVSIVGDAVASVGPIEGWRCDACA